LSLQIVLFHEINVAGEERPALVTPL